VTIAERPLLGEKGKTLKVTGWRARKKTKAKHFGLHQRGKRTQNSTDDLKNNVEKEGFREVLIAGRGDQKKDRELRCRLNENTNDDVNTQE